MMWTRVRRTAALLTLTAVPATLTAQQATLEPLSSVSSPIVNGLPTSGFPSTVALLQDDKTLCTGTLIGCQTVLTAAHCVCDSVGANCGPGGVDLVSPAELLVYSQHSGIFPVASIRVHSNYGGVGVGHDVALLELAAPGVLGVTPASINQLQTPAHGTSGTIVGFGQADGLLDIGSGVKRAGSISTGPCGPYPEPEHVCWLFETPVGPPGLDSTTCQGDSGGPLFVNFGQGALLTGITSGGLGIGCLPPDLAWDTNVYHERDWILANAANPLGQSSCGALPSAGGPNAAVTHVTNVLSFLDPMHSYGLEVPEDTFAIVVTLNGEDYDPILGQPAENDFDLLMGIVIPPSQGGLCSSDREGTYEVCAAASPEAGTWLLRVDNFNGLLGQYQLTATIFGQPGACVADENTACLLDGKFKVEGVMSTFDTPPEVIPTRVMNFGSSGRAESDQAVFFESFSPGNFEAGVKMVDGCGLPDGHPLQAYWAFFGALTNADTRLSVEDTVTDEIYEWSNPPGTFPQSVGDTAAFPCISESQNSLCFPGTPETACLLGGRFRVTGVMKDFGDPPQSFPARVMYFPGSGRAESDQAVFWESFSSGNFEAGVKMVDGCGFPPGHPLRAYWAFYGALTNAETLIQITQLSSGLVDVWHNPPGAFPFSEGRTNAFPCE